mmetsp:Transcript_160626/g.283220  ORF Transcript_160626/g.283220 Transcript_160626/m.283220 type:complete len:194 (-) Transcript_160626:48-629(-)
MSVLDGLALYMEDNGCLSELETFIRTYCMHFGALEEEQTHECFVVFQTYEALVKGVLVGFLEESRRDMNLVGLSTSVTVERMVAALQEERAEHRPDMPGRMLRSLIAITSYEEFAAAARQYRAEYEAMTASTSLPLSASSPAVVEVEVAVPEGAGEGYLLPLDYAGMRYQVPVPPGFAPGSIFRVALACDARA